MDFDLPDREEIACALDTLEVRLARQGQYDGAADVGSAHRLLRAADDEIASLRTALAEAQRERDELRADLVFFAYFCRQYREATDTAEGIRLSVCVESQDEFYYHDGTDADLCRAIREARRGE